MIASPTTLTPRTIFDALGIRNVYLGRYRRVDGSVVAGPERVGPGQGEVA